MIRELNRVNYFIKNNVTKIFNEQLVRKLATSEKRMIHDPKYDGIPGSNLAINISNRYMLTAILTAYLAFPFALPFAIWRARFLIDMRAEKKQNLEFQ